MILKRLFCLMGCTLILSGCGVLVHRAAIESADSKIKAGGYKDALNELDNAEKYAEPKPVDKSAIYCLRGMCYEGLGENDSALKAYNYVVDNTPDTDYWYYAKDRLKVLEVSAIPMDSILKYINIARKSLPEDKTSEYYWFPGMLNPPALSPVIPDSFDVFPATPINKDRMDCIVFDMYSGVLWTDKAVGCEYAFQRNTNWAKIQKPVFWVRLSSDVAQIPGTGDFTIEKSLSELNKTIGVTDVVIDKKFIGNYPVLILTGKRNDNSGFYCAWLGCNSPDGWAFLIDYKIPLNASAEEKNTYIEIWNNFISKTRNMG